MYLLNLIKENPDNPRIIKDAEYLKLVQSIKEFPKGMRYKPLLLDMDNKIIAGNQRRRALIDNGYKEIPDNWVVWVNDLTDDEISRLIILDNVHAGEWNYETLANEWDAQALNSWGLKIPGWEDPDNGKPANAIPDLEQDMYQPDLSVQTDIKPGDLFTIGQHRLLCADARLKKNVTKLMATETAAMAFWDPHYGTNANGGRADVAKTKNLKAIANDKLEGAELVKFLAAALENMPLAPGGSFYICFDHKTAQEFITATCKPPRALQNIIVWNKNVFGLSGKRGYRPKHELLLFGSIGRDYNWHGDKAQANVWDIARADKKETKHRTPKPVEVPARAILNSTAEGEIVNDNFAGSGSTMVACHKLKRICYSMELDPVHCHHIIDRMLYNDPNLEVTRNGTPYTLPAQTV